MGRIAAWLLGVPLALLVVLYLVLLVTPIPLPFVNQQVRNMVATAMPEGAGIELGDMALALEGYVWPVIQFRPVTYTDRASGARVTMDALEVGFSPIRAIVGQPGATVTVVRPYIQVNQDMFGPRLVSFNLVPDPNGGPAVVQIIEGADAFPEVGFSPEGVDVKGALPPSALQMRSDNDWLIYNIEAAEQGLAQIVEQANQGSFSRLIVKNAELDMNDAVYGFLRSFRAINVDVSPSPDGKVVAGRFSADFGGTVMSGNLERTLEDGGISRLTASIANLDLAAFVPFINDPDSLTGIAGASAVSIDVTFDAATGRIRDGLFHIDMTGTDIRIDDEYFPIATSIMEIAWKPHEGEFTMAETQMSIADSTAYMQGVFKLGLDELYGPVVNVSMQGRDVRIVNELGPPEEPFSRVAFQGWSAPLYGATGIDQFIAEKADGAQIATKGRIDVLQRGVGFDMTIAGDGVTADDLKRLWPGFLATEGRDWFVRNVVGGKLRTSSMRYSFPVGTLEPGPDGKQKPMPKNAINIDLVGEGVQIIPMDGMSPITVEGETRFQMRDQNLSVSADGARIDTGGGSVAIANVGFTMAGETPGETIIEISGDLSGGIPALVALAREQQPDLLESNDLPIDISALDGSLSLSLVSTIVVDDDGEQKSMDYAINGVVQDFNSTAPLDSHTIGNGQLSFVASQEGFRVAGQAEVDGLPADIVIQGKLEENAAPPEILLSATLNADDLKKLGFDASQFLSGEVEFVAKPLSDGTIQMAVDVTKATLTVKDLGISKARGVAGALRAAIRQRGDVTEVSQVDIAFGDVKLQGSLAFDNKAGQLQAAEFTSFALSPGDEAQLSLTPIRGGYQVRLRGDQLDLKPMVKRFFDLGEGSTGAPQVSAFTNTTIALDVELKRALGFYKTTAFNLDLDLALRGSDVQRASLQANFANESSVSVTTNPTPEGKVMTVAFNDLGTVLRLMNIYPNIQGGQGTLVLQTISDEKADYGKFVLRNFAIVDETNVAQLMEGNRQSRQAARSNMEFRSGEVSFVRRKDRVEITDAVLAGDTVGGSARGFIYTDSRQYDITGTYVPIFGLNNVMGRLLGPLAGRDGEGLFGITFAIKGPLDKPDFRVNPMSALVPGAFRRMFEYRAREIPRVE